MSRVTEKEIAIIIPLPLTDSFTEAEKISLQHLITHLSKYDTYFVVAEEFKSKHIDVDGFRVKRFPNKYFGSILAHNKLLTNKIFYEAFTDYKFILIYHLDSLVFSDQMLYWCEKDYDCIAPPWLKSEMKWLDKSGVGNGGFALRKVESLIKLYSSKEYWHPPHKMADKIASKNKLLYWLIYPITLLIFKLRIFNNQKLHLNKYLKQKWSAEDRFIFNFGQQYYPDLKIASVDEALKFAFEKNPNKCYEMNDNTLPFGCHAFERYDLSFWEPHLLKPNNKDINIKIAQEG